MPQIGDKIVFGSTPSVIWLLVLIVVLFVLPWLFGKFMVYRGFIAYLKDKKQDVYNRLLRSSSFRAMGMFSRDWISYIGSPTDTEDPYIDEMKKKSLLVFKYYKYMFIGLVLLGALMFLTIMIMAMIAGLK